MSILIAFAGHVRQAANLDATAAMLVQARRLAERSATQNVSWHLGDVYALPFNDDTFDIVSCRFALHHFETPAGAFTEMVRVCRPGKRIVAVRCHCVGRRAQGGSVQSFGNGTAISQRWNFARSAFYQACLPPPVCPLHVYAIRYGSSATP